MPVPAFHSLMLPMLRMAEDGQTRTNAVMEGALADELGLSDTERSELLNSGQRRFANRVNWAAMYLYRAGLLERPQRGHYRISDLGRAELAKGRQQITPAMLEEYPAFRDFIAGNSPDSAGEGALPPSGDESPAAALTPSEAIDASYLVVRADLAAQVLDLLKTNSPAFFERAVVDLLLGMGYGGSRRDAGEAVGRSGDGGIDGVIKEDRLGLDVVYIQAKRWEGTVGRPVVQAFVGALEGHRATKGVMITTSQFSPDAHRYAAGIAKRVILIEGPRLAELMMDYDIGVKEQSRYVIKTVDSDYFVEE